jgi:DHA2 family multidrug resistance protein
MFVVLGFVLLPTIALTSPMLDESLGYPADLTGYMALPRSMALVAALVVTLRVLPRFDMRLVVAAGMALVVYGNWRMLGYSPAMDWRPVIIAGMAQGAGLGIMMPGLTKAAFSTLDPAFRAEGSAFFTPARFYGSTIGIALVQTYLYGNTQAMHIALARNLTPYHAAARVGAVIARPQLAALNAMVTDQAVFIGLIGQFKLLMIAMLVVSPLVLLLRKPRPAAG